jgi:uncharacterized protein YyaL (SSP411 family)
MEHESFESDQVAALMNDLFVNIKVDREERPDIDEIYMKAVVALSGGGGWPMSVFLTPDQKPYFGGTYFPPERKYGRPSFPDLLRAMAQAWSEQREEVLAQATQLTAHIAAEAEADLRGELAPDLLDRSQRDLLAVCDRTWGGFGNAPKFPHALDLRMCLRHHLRTQDPEPLECTVLTLDRMARGGIYDQLGGGFHRYSTDTQWRIPHFEKMLYDNALLVPAYLEAFLITGQSRFAEVARECCEWALREMLTKEGAFASAQDADSEGEEGKFFAWTPDELREVLGNERGDFACAYFNVTNEGNFEHGKSALWLPREPVEVASELGIELEALERAMQEAKQALFEARKQRVAPATDDKVLVAWNGLFISALCQAHQVLDEPRYLEAARRAASYVLEHMQNPDGSLYATARNGRVHLQACLDDYVFLAQGLIDLYESCFDLELLHHAKRLCAIVEARFWDVARGGYFTTGEDHERLVARTKNVHDGALPAGAGVQALNLVRLFALTVEPDLERAATATLDAYAALANRHPRLFSQLLLAVDFKLGSPREVVISGARDSAETQALLRAVRTTFMPARVVALADGASESSAFPLLEGRAPVASGARAFVCTNGSCKLPVTTEVDLRAQLLER